MDKKIILLGYSGHAYAVIDAAHSSNITIAGYCDKQLNKKNPFELEYLGTEDEERIEAMSSGCFVFPSVGDNHLRAKLLAEIEQKKWSQTNVIHHTSMISRYAKLDSSVFISNGAIINALATIGKGSIINTGAIIEHECLIQEYCHIAPGAVLAGDVVVGSKTFVGANATVKQGVKIGANVIIGAGAVVIEDIPDGMTYVGNPARNIKR